MKTRHGKIAVATTTFTLAILLSVDWSGQDNVSVSVEKAQARVGRPLTPVSVAGVARRQYRRGAYGYGYGYGAVGAGLAVGAATVAAATYPWGYQAYRHPYAEGEYAAYAEDPTVAGGYYASSPWGYYECRIPHPYDCQPYSHVGWYHY